MKKPEKISDKTRFLLFWLGAVILELPLLFLLAGYPLSFIPFWLGFIAHLLAAAMVFLAPPLEKGLFRYSRHWGEPLGLICLLLPGIGCFLAGYLVITEWRATIDKHAYIFEDDAPQEANPLAGMGTHAAIQREMADAMDVVPAVDALLSGDPGLKRGAIEALYRIQSADAVNWIRKARGDDNPEVRFYATTALTRLKHDFESSILAAEKEVYARPGELGPQTGLQRVRYEYAVVGILEDEAKDAYLEECRARLQTLSRRSLDAAHLLFLVEKELDPDRALAALDYLEKVRPERHARWVKARAELLFSEGRLDDVHSLLTKHRAELGVIDEVPLDERQWHAALLWWSNV